MKKIEYKRKMSVKYAEKWAYKRNAKYYNFDNIGGDCTNFISQCLYAGSKEMNYNKQNGWYYNSVNDRSPSWTGVNEFYKFLTTNKQNGPRGKEVLQNEIEIGDIIQISFSENKYTHTLIVVDIKDVNNLNEIYTASHTFDSFKRRVSSYKFEKLRFIHIEGIYKY